MRRAWPHLLFAAITLTIFWRFLFLGESVLGAPFIRHHLGLPLQDRPDLFDARPPHTRVPDDVFLFPTLHRAYNAGLKEGELRLWHPNFFCGYPLYVNPMVHPFYPPNLVLHAALPPRAAHGTCLMLHLFLAGVAMYAALRAMGRGTVAAAAGGSIWMLAGYNAAWFNTGVLLGLSVFSPLALLCLRRALERKDPGWAALAGASMGLAILGSHPQHALNFFLVFTAWLGVEAARDPASRRFILQAGALFAVFAVGVGLAEILPRLETIAQGYRSTEMDLPLIYRDAGEMLSHLPGLAIGKSRFLEGPQETEFCAYVGLAALALAILGAARGFREPLVRLLAVFAVAALLVAYLRPLAWIVYRVPLLNLSPPYRWLSVFAFAVAILAARGVDAWSADGRKRALALAMAAATALFLLACAIRLGSVRLSNGAAVETLVGFGLATGAALAAWKLPRAAPPLAIGAILFDLVPYFLAFNWHTDPSVLDAEPAAIRFLRERDAGPWRATGGLWSRFRADNPMPDIHAGNCALAVYGVENPAGFDAVPPSSYMAFAARAGGHAVAGGRILHFPGVDSPLLDLANLKYLLMPSSARPAGRYKEAGRFGDVTVFENTTALPRAWVVPRARVRDGQEEALASLQDPGFDPRVEVVLEGASPPPASAALKAEVTWLPASTSDFVALQVRSSAPGILVLADAHDPGWEARVGDQEVPVWRANGAFRAVAVPAGESRVEFRFRPASVRHGLLGSALFGLLALAYAAWRRKRSPQPEKQML